MGLVLRTLSEVSAVMNAVSACDVMGTAAVDRRPLPCGSGVGVVVGSRQQSLRSAAAHSPHENQRSIAAMQSSNFFDARAWGKGGVCEFFSGMSVSVGWSGAFQSQVV